ncbi:Kinetochore-associated protein NNF1 [Candida viswanathii]|uniref:Kinetochore-associated protein n=1 Tax=Candida viswanathii TaxID=5486 RepID=A0A367YJS3_9ASCO|nr:Kinetochore-associated protein NNF1 [Candida viswanathii]
MPDANKDSNNIEKVRFERLRLVARRALEELIKKSLSIDQVSTCFPTLVNSEDGLISLESALSQMSGFWHSNSLAEFDLIYKEKDMEAKLDELDEIIHNAQTAKDAGEKPSNIDRLSALEIVDSTIMSNSNDVPENMQMIYDLLRAENQDLYKELSRLVTECKDAEGSIDTTMAQIKGEANSHGREEIHVDNLVNILEN